jgi:hypothetical protein
MTGGCPPPSFGLDQLPELAEAHGRQCVTPLTLRWLAQAFLIAPEGVRRQLAGLLSGDGTVNDLLLLENPDLDQELRGIVRLDLAAPKRAIQEGVGEFVDRQKGATRAREVRRRDSLEDQLAAWDAREGWAGGDYDVTKEKRLREVAMELREPVDTVRSRCDAAFRLITGFDYDPDLWLVLFGPLKLPASKLGGWRRKKQGRQPGAPKAITEATLCPPSAGEGGRPCGLEGLARPNASQAAWQELCSDVKLDIETLAKRGKTDEQIAMALEMDPKIVQSLRDHYGF